MNEVAAPSPDEEPKAKLIGPAIGMLLLLTTLTGILYPIAIYLGANLLFPHQAHGSLIEDHERTVGSGLIGQQFSNPRYFWGRPSATASEPDNAASSSGSNLGPLNPGLREAIVDRVAALRAADRGKGATIPVDLVTASGSGIDPDISIAAARYQAGRVARVRGLPVAMVDGLIDRLAQPSQYGVLGAPRINVLGLNQGLDMLTRDAIVQTVDAP